MAEVGVPPEKKAKVAMTVETMMDRIVNKAVKSIDSRWDLRCEELMGKFMSKVDGKIATSEQRAKMLHF